MSLVRFKAINSWPLLRMMEYSLSGDCKSMGITAEENDLLKGLLADCLVPAESGFVTMKSSTVENLTIAMKALDYMASNAEKIVGVRNAPRCSAQTRSLRRKILEAKTRLDLTGSI